ncbi:MAG: molybdenum cofactor guanylyltransferase [Chromatiales bacterium]|nr:molybdenum cofactor guanylyltransferase [Chromatiales bacterium]
MREAPLRAVILAGGQSRRFGRDKASIPLDGITLLERTFALAAGAGLPTVVAVRPDQLDDPLRVRLPCITDLPGVAGPAAGLLGAHLGLPSSAWLLLACDMPRLDAALLSMLLSGRDPGAAATAFTSPADGRPEPLCAIYEPATLARLAPRAMRQRPPSLRAWLEREPARLLAAPATDVLASANTPGELQRLAGARRAGMARDRTPD